MKQLSGPVMYGPQAGYPCNTFLAFRAERCVGNTVFRLIVPDNSPFRMGLLDNSTQFLAAEIESNPITGRKTGATNMLFTNHDRSGVPGDSDPIVAGQVLFDDDIAVAALLQAVSCRFTLVVTKLEENHPLRNQDVAGLLSQPLD